MRAGHGFVRHWQMCRKSTVGLHLEWPEEDMEWALRDSGACVLLLLPLDDAALVERVHSAAAKAGVPVLAVGPGGTGLVPEPEAIDEEALEALLVPSLANGPEEPEVEADGGLLYALMYTSGTSGRPKVSPPPQGRARLVYSCGVRTPGRQESRRDRTCQKWICGVLMTAVLPVLGGACLKFEVFGRACPPTAGSGRPTRRRRRRVPSP
jgi:hypothetical protein